MRSWRLLWGNSKGYNRHNIQPTFPLGVREQCGLHMEYTRRTGRHHCSGVHGLPARGQIRLPWDQWDRSPIDMVSNQHLSYTCLDHGKKTACQHLEMAYVRLFVLWWIMVSCLLSATLVWCGGRLCWDFRATKGGSCPLSRRSGKWEWVSFVSCGIKQLPLITVVALHCTVGCYYISACWREKKYRMFMMWVLGGGNITHGSIKCCVACRSCQL